MSGAHWLRYDGHAHWLVAGDDGAFGHAVLRRHYAGTPNSIEAYSRKKLRRDDGPLDEALPRLDVSAIDFVVPPYCPDLLARPGALWPLVDAATWAEDLALVINLAPRGFTAEHLAFRGPRATSRRRRSRTRAGWRRWSSHTARRGSATATPTTPTSSRRRASSGRTGLARFPSSRAAIGWRRCGPSGSRSARRCRPRGGEASGKEGWDASGKMKRHFANLETMHDPRSIDDERGPAPCPAR